MPELPAFFESADLIEIQQLSANESFAPLTRLCRVLGLDAETEAGYAVGYPILASGLRTINLQREHGPEPTPCLRVDLVPFWLMTLHHDEVAPSIKPKLQAYQRECASILWQQFRPQGFNTEDTLLPPRGELAPADHAYIGEMAQANLARQQMLIERQLNAERERIDDPQAVTLAQFVRRVAQSLSARTYRNEYGGVFQGLFRQFGITSYRRMPAGRLHEALEWLERWYGDIEGEPEPPPDI